jgi:hypothetical protein
MTKYHVLAVMASFLGLSPLVAGEHKLDAARLPPTAKGVVDFMRDVQPMLMRTCIRCHSTPERVVTVNFARNKGGFSLSNRAEALAGGSQIGTVIVPGSSAKSPLIHLVAGFPIGEVRAMPYHEATRLSREEVGTLRAWIDQGVAWPKDAVLSPSKAKP